MHNWYQCFSLCGFLLAIFIKIDLVLPQSWTTWTKSKTWTCMYENEYNYKNDYDYEQKHDHYSELGIMRIYHWVKGCLSYIFASLFCMSKQSTFETRRKIFYFASKALLILEILTFSQILTFEIFKCHDVIKCLNMKHETQSGDEVWTVYVTLQKKTFYQKIKWKIWPGNHFSPF